MVVEKYLVALSVIGRDDRRREVVARAVLNIEYVEYEPLTDGMSGHINAMFRTRCSLVMLAYITQRVYCCDCVLNA